MSNIGEKITLSPRIRHRILGAEGVLVHLEQGRVIVINEVGVCVVGLLSDSEAPMTREELVHSVVEQYDVSMDQATNDVHAFIEQLDQENALTFTT